LLIKCKDVQDDIEDQLLKEAGSNFVSLARELAASVNAETIYQKYFASFDFIEEQLRKRYKSEGKTDFEIFAKLEAKKQQYLKEQNNCRLFGFNVRLLIVNTRIKNTLSLQVGLGSSFQKPNVLIPATRLVERSVF
jgi:hypothetical protein